MRSLLAPLSLGLWIAGAHAGASSAVPVNAPSSNTRESGAPAVVVAGAAAGKSAASAAAGGWGLEAHDGWYALSLGLTEAVALGDLDRDGRQDVVLASRHEYSGGHLAWFRQLANGTLQPPVILPHNQPFTVYPSIAILDLDAQYGPDVVIGGTLGLSVFRSVAVGGLVGSPVLPSGRAEVLMTLDLDLDGREDLASAARSGIGRLHRSQGDGTLASTSWPIGATGSPDMAKADFNGDGRIDLALLAPPVRIYLNEIDGLRLLNSLPGSCPGGSSSLQGIGAGDLNHDGRADLVVSGGGNSPGGCLLVYYGLRHSQFSAPLPLPSYDIPGTLRVADIDNDGRDDVVVLHEGWNAIGVYLQRADATLAPERLFYVATPSHFYAHALEIGDITGDGCPDVAIAGGGLGTLRGVGCEAVFRSGFESP